MHDQNIQKLLRFLRNDKTQKEMSAFLELKENEYHRWEVGYKKIELNDFKKVLKKLNIEFDLACKNAFLLPEPAESSVDLIRQIENRFPCDQEQFLNRAGYSETKWWRLKNENKNLKLIDFFTIIHYRSYKLYKFFSEIGFVDYSLDFTPKELMNKLERFKFFMREYDFFPTLSASIYLKEVVVENDFDKKVEFIAKRIKRPENLIKGIIQSLINEEILIIKKDNSLDFATFESNFGNDAIDIGKQIYSNVFHDSISYIEHPELDCRFNYRVAPVSEEAAKKIQEIQSRCSNEIYDVIINDSAKNRTEIINLISSSFTN